MAGPDRRPVRPHHLRPPAGASRGIALVLVLWVLTLLTVMAVGMTAAQRTETALTDNLMADARFRALSDAAITYTVYNFISPPAGEGLAMGGQQNQANADLPQPWLPNGAPKAWGFDGNQLSIAVSNEQSRINLNQAPAQVLAALLRALGVDEESAAAIADAISDWRDADDLKLVNGAEDSDYQQAGRALGAKDAPFVAVEELQQVLGVNRGLYRLLALEVTVDTESQQVDQTFASAAVLAALQGLSTNQATIQAQQRNNPALANPLGTRVVNRGGPLYRIQVKEQGRAGTARAMEALVEIVPGQTPPYRLRWRRFGLIAPPPVVPMDNG
jgi:general secretion pathway protein K